VQVIAARKVQIEKHSSNAIYAGQKDIIRMHLNFKVLNNSNTNKRTKEAYHQLAQSLLPLQLDLQ
jgi:hypothetical protein